MEKSTKNVLIAAGAGVAVGAILGVLFAPAKGSETRAKIASKASDIKDEVISKTSDLKNRVVGEKSPEELLRDLKKLIVSDESDEKERNSLMKKLESLEESILNV